MNGSCFGMPTYPMRFKRFIFYVVILYTQCDILLCEQSCEFCLGPFPPF